MKKKKVLTLNSEEMKHTVTSIDYEKPGVRVVGGEGVPGSCLLGANNDDTGGCYPGMLDYDDGDGFTFPRPMS